MNEALGNLRLPTGKASEGKGRSFTLSFTYHRSELTNIFQLKSRIPQKCNMWRFR